MSPDLSVTIAGVRLERCIMNASGPRCTTYQELAELGRSASGAIVAQPATQTPQEATRKPNYHQFASGSFLSVRVANPGYRAMGEMIPRLKEMGKPVIASVAAATPEEYASIGGYIAAQGPDLLELDLSSTYPPDNRLTAYNPRLMGSIFEEARKAIRVPLGVKTPIFLDPVNLKALASRLINTGMDFLVTASAATASLVIDVEKEQAVLTGAGGVGMVAGPVLMPMILGNVRILAGELEGRIPVIGAGGVACGRDAFSYILAGASAVQVGTAYAREGTSVFARISGELSDLMAAKGYAAVADFRGKLKDLN